MTSPGQTGRGHKEADLELLRSHHLNGHNGFQDNRTSLWEGWGSRGKISSLSPCQGEGSSPTLPHGTDGSQTERQFTGIHAMSHAILQHHPHANDLMPSQQSCRIEEVPQCRQAVAGCAHLAWYPGPSLTCITHVQEPFLYARNEVLGNVHANCLVHKLPFCETVFRHWLPQ